MGGSHRRYYWAKRIVSMGQDYLEFYKTKADVGKHPAAGGAEYAHWKGLSINPDELVRVRVSMRTWKALK